eukprot:c21469_g1_i1 orf=322-600(-)
MGINSQSSMLVSSQMPSVSRLHLCNLLDGTASKPNWSHSLLNFFYSTTLGLELQYPHRISLSSSVNLLYLMQYRSQGSIHFKWSALIGAIDF